MQIKSNNKLAAVLCVLDISSAGKNYRA